MPPTKGMGNATCISSSLQLQTLGFHKTMLGKWGKYPVLPQTRFLYFKFWGGKCRFGVFVMQLFFPASPSSQQSPSRVVVTPRVPRSHLSSPLQLKSGHSRMSVQAIVPLITAKSQSKLEMVRAIWFWLCHNIGKSGPAVL